MFLENILRILQENPPTLPSSEIFRNLFTVAGILAGFALTAGIEILVNNPYDGKKKSKLINLVRWFYLSCALLIGAFFSFAVLANYAAMVRVEMDSLLSFIDLASKISLGILLAGVVLLVISLYMTMAYWSSSIRPPSESLSVEQQKKLRIFKLVPGKTLFFVVGVFAVLYSIGVWLIILRIINSM